MILFYFIFLGEMNVKKEEENELKSRKLNINKTNTK